MKSELRKYLKDKEHKARMQRRYMAWAYALPERFDSYTVHYVSLLGDTVYLTLSAPLNKAQANDTHSWLKQNGWSCYDLATDSTGLEGRYDKTINVRGKDIKCCLRLYYFADMSGSTCKLQEVDVKEEVVTSTVRKVTYEVVCNEADNPLEQKEMQDGSSNSN